MSDGHRREAEMFYAQVTRTGGKYPAVGVLLIMGGVISWTMVPLRFALIPVLVGVGVFVYGAWRH